MNIIEQARIVSTALDEEGSFYNNTEGLAQYLEISKSKVYQLNRVWVDMIPEVKEWFRGTEFQCRKAYDTAVLTEGEQREFLRGMNVLVEGRE